MSAPELFGPKSAWIEARGLLGRNGINPFALWPPAQCPADTVQTPGLSRLRRPVPFHGAATRCSVPACARDVSAAIGGVSAGHWAGGHRAREFIPSTSEPGGDRGYICSKRSSKMRSRISPLRVLLLCILIGVSMTMSRSSKAEPPAPAGKAQSIPVAKAVFPRIAMRWSPAAGQGEKWANWARHGLIVTGVTGLGL